MIDSPEASITGDVIPDDVGGRWESPGGTVRVESDADARLVKVEILAVDDLDRRLSAYVRLSGPEVRRLQGLLTNAADFLDDSPGCDPIVMGV